jgi:hypothetical protein
MTQDSPRSLLAPWQGTYTAQSGSPQSSILTKTGRNGVLCKFGAVRYVEEDQQDPAFFPEPIKGASEIPDVS